jgi:hypothetical protein
MLGQLATSFANARVVLLGGEEIEYEVVQHRISALGLVSGSEFDAESMYCWVKEQSHKMRKPCQCSPHNGKQPRSEFLALRDQNKRCLLSVSSVLYIIKEIKAKGDADKPVKAG